MFVWGLNQILVKTAAQCNYFHWGDIAIFLFLLCKQSILSVYNVLILVCA